MRAMASLQRRLFFSLLALVVLVPRLGATWSIVVVDRRTGEVCIASATCIPRLDLSAATPVLLVGVGGGVTQSVLDDGSNKVRIFEGFLAGTSPQDILARIRAEDPGVATRQFGIVDFRNAPLSFTGRQAGPAKKSVSGEIDGFVYAIQGNILTAELVIDECERVLRESVGDTPTRVLAAMVRARELGGDGRCSCGDSGSLGDCGVPDPDEFEKSAHCGFLIVARPGDGDGTCAVGASCVTGDYWLRLNVRGADALHASPDPVDQLVERFAAWRLERAGRPDGLLSRAETVDSLPADGRTERVVSVKLVDLEGEPLTLGGATLSVASVDGEPLHALPGPVEDHGDGTYSFVLRAGTTSGLDRLAIRAEDGLVRATLYPYTEVRSDLPARLHAGRDELSAAAPREVPFVIDEPTRAHAKFWLLAELAHPKFRGAGFRPEVLRGLIPATPPFFPAPPGELDADGRGEASFTPAAAALGALVGWRLSFTARIVGRGAPLDSAPVELPIVP
jgi:hypothetical protein